MTPYAACVVRCLGAVRRGGLVCASIFGLAIAGPLAVQSGTGVAYAAGGPPVVESSSVSAVTTTGATLRASINPEGAATRYHFEYVAQSDYEASGFANATKAPVPDGELGSGLAAVSVNEAIGGLTAGTRYEYRIVATNEVEMVASAVKEFETFTASTPVEPGQYPGEGFLPENRAWEMVSPPDKNGSGLAVESISTWSAPDGNRVAYLSLAGYGDQVGSGTFGTTQYVATRQSSGWTSHAITPTPNPAWQQQLLATTRVLLAPDLQHGAVVAYQLPYVEGGIPEGVVNIYHETLDTMALEAVTTPLAGPVSTFSLSQPVGGSSDFGHIVFASRANLVSGPTGSETKLYDWDHGALRLAGVLPNETIPSESIPPLPFYTYTEGQQYTRDSVSEDGERILFSADPGEGRQLYMRKEHASTVWISESEGSVPVASPEGVRYEAASPDLHEVAFTTASVLTNEDPGGPGTALYVYKDSPDPEHESNLTFVERGEPLVWGMSKDGTGLIFTDGEELRFWDSTGVHLSSLSLGELRPDYSEIHSGKSPVRVSADARTAAFISTEALAGANNPRHDSAMYVYDSKTDKLACASCIPTGAELESNVYVSPHSEDGGVGGNYSVPPHFLTSDGALVFFATADALVPGDTNGRIDVYEYSVGSGQAQLLSSGASAEDSWFADASPNGHDVFFLTNQALSKWDTDTAADLYDARVHGGLPEPELPPPGCVGDACQPAPLQLEDVTPASSVFNAPPSVAAGGAPAARHVKARPRRCVTAKRRVRDRRKGRKRSSASCGSSHKRGRRGKGRNAR